MKTDYKKIYSEQLELHRELFTPEVLEALMGHLEVRLLKKNPPTERAVSLLIKKLKSFTLEPNIAVAIVDRSIVNNWLDFYDLAPDQKSKVQREVKSTKQDRAIWK